MEKDKLNMHIGSLRALRENVKYWEQLVEDELDKTKHTATHDQRQCLYQAKVNIANAKYTLKDVADELQKELCRDIQT